MFQTIFEFLFKYRPLVFTEGRLTFQSPIGIALLIPVVVLVVALAMWTYRSVAGKATDRDRVVLATLRACALAIIAFALLRPVLLVSSVVPQQNYVAVVFDDSRSMRIIDDDEARSAFVAQAFGPGSALVAQLEDRFQLRYFGFSASTERLNDPGMLSFAGSNTRIAPALDRVREDLAALPLSGIVVVTDGADNSALGMTESLLALQAAQVPVYTVGLGHEHYAKDVELSRVSTPRTVLKGASLVVDLLVSQSGYTGKTVRVVVEDDGRIVGSEEVTLPPDGEPVPVRVHFTAEEAGARRFRFRVPAQADEMVLENNEQEALIDVRDDRRKILFYEGEPRWEVGFMRRAVDADPNIQLVVLQRTAENKYMRLSVDDSTELFQGFPRTREELFTYDAIVLGTVEASAFTHEQMRMIADFVGDRGGGLLTFGGRRSYAEGGWTGTPVAEIMPIDIESSSPIDTLFFDSLVVRPTRAGQTHPAMQLAGSEAASRTQWESLPRISTANRLGPLKPGATALLTGRGDILDEHPVLAFQRFGSGLSIALAAQDTWLWQMIPPLEDMSHETFWRQMLRWLVNDSPDQVTVALPADRSSPGEAVRIIANVSDEAFVRVNSSMVTAKITSPTGQVSELPLDWTIEQDGEYRSVFTPQETGLHRIDVEAVYGDRTVASDPAYIDIAESRSEYFGSQLNATLLQRISRETGGRHYTPSTVSSLPEDLSITGRGSTVIEEKDLWDMPILLLLLLSMMAAEWLYRRRKGLA
ncbi:MAG TPA: glutamine amidotransferase [Longimicrobiales bacterium]|nr:glutamine amidotransferase [Longimicrobiales bacterium]